MRNLARFSYQHGGTAAGQTAARSVSTAHTAIVFPSPATSREWVVTDPPVECRQDHYQVIGRYVDLNASDVRKCPFGDHHAGGEGSQASFKVYDPGVPGSYY